MLLFEWINNNHLTNCLPCDIIIKENGWLLVTAIHDLVIFLIHLSIMKITLAINLEVLGIDLIIFGKNIIKQFEISLALYVNRQGQSIGVTTLNPYTVYKQPAIKITSSSRYLLSRRCIGLTSFQDEFKIFGCV